MRSPSRKFIDLILSASSKWANWDPSHQIQVGDFGVVDKETGQFEQEGNIYQHPNIAQLAKGCSPITAAQENRYIVASNAVKYRDLSLGPDIGIAGIAEASIKGRWEFGKKRGALLLMWHPRSSYIPPNILLERLVNVPELRGKSLVTQVTACQAYCLYLSTTNNDVVDVAFLARIPLPVAPGVSPGGELGTAWWNQNATGIFRDAYDSTGSYSYTPLYTLKRIRQQGLLRRDSPVPDPEGDDLWVNTLEPWDQLDEEGDEQPYEDTVFD